MLFSAQTVLLEDLLDWLSAGFDQDRHRDLEKIEIEERHPLYRRLILTHARRACAGTVSSTTCVASWLRVVSGAVA